MFEDILRRISDLNKRLNRLETVEYNSFNYISANTYLVHTTILAGNVFDSGDLRSYSNMKANARGFIGTMWITPLAVNTVVAITPSNNVPNTSWDFQYRWLGAVDSDRELISQSIMMPFGPDGGIKITASANTEVFIIAHGYWL